MFMTHRLTRYWTVSVLSPRGRALAAWGATVKHFVGNNSELDRNNTDSIIDERTLRDSLSLITGLRQSHSSQH
jgi:hypothetical protein